MKKTVLALPVLFACALPAAHAATAQKANQAVYDAVQANLQVKEAGFLWRDTYTKLIGPAKAAYREGSYDKALNLAMEAKAHAELGMQQARQSKDAGPRF
jgi:opacity protein-like surface antigen